MEKWKRKILRATLSFSMYLFRKPPWDHAIFICALSVPARFRAEGRRWQNDPLSTGSSRRTFSPVEILIYFSFFKKTSMIKNLKQQRKHQANFCVCTWTLPLGNACLVPVAAVTVQLLWLLTVSHLGRPGLQTHSVWWANTEST